MERAHAAKVLGVALSATPEQVRAAFRRRARDVHPDAAGGDDSAMVELNAARDALIRTAEPDWEFAAAPDPFDLREDEPPYFDPDDERGGGVGPLARFGIALGIASAVLLAIVFVVAIGYDWSLSP